MPGHILHPSGRKFMTLSLDQPSGFYITSTFYKLYMNLLVDEPHLMLILS